MATPDGSTTPSRSARSGALRWARRIAAALSTLLLLVLLAAGGIVWWVLNHDDGLTAALARVPGLTVTAPRGRLHGGPFKADRLTYMQGGLSVVVTDVSWQDLRWTFRPHPSIWFGIEIDALSAARVEVQTGPPVQPKKPPTSFRLPVALALPNARVQALQIDALPSVSDVTATLSLGADGGSLHRIESLVFTLQKLRAQTWGTVGADAPLAVALDAQAQSNDGAPNPWRASARVTGPLATLDVQLKAEAGDASPAPAAGTTPPPRASIEARTTVSPYAPWPLNALAATLRDVDLATLMHNVPQTRIHGTIEVASPSRDSPLLVNARLQNELTGRWDAQRLPVARLDVVASGTLDQRDRLDFTHLDITLAGNGGQVQGQGQWLRDALNLTFNAQAVRPSQIDARLASMTMTGPSTLRVTGLPAPDAAMAGQASPPDGVLEATLQSRIRGPLDARKALVADIQIDASARRQHDTLAIAVDTFVARVATARASLGGKATRDPAGAWTVNAKGDVVNFDPLPWYPGAPGSAWREGGHRFDGAWRADMTLPAATGAASETATTLQALALRAVGAIDVTLADSRLARVPLQGQLQWRHAANRPADIQAEAKSGANTARVQGQWAAQGTDDRWQVDLDAPAFASLAPLARLHPALAAWLPRSGAAQAKARLEGRWPQVASIGSATVERLQVGAWRVGQAQAEWTLSRNPQAPLALQLTARDVVQGVQVAPSTPDPATVPITPNGGAGQQAVAANPGNPRIESLRLAVSGTLAAHRFDAQATSPLRPPAWGETMAGGVNGADPDRPPPPNRGSIFTSQGDGTWSPKGNAADFAGGTWRVGIATLNARSRDATVPEPWVDAQNLKAVVQVDPNLDVIDAQITPGNARVLGAGLRWTLARIQRDQGMHAPPAVNVDAQLDPLRVAPLLTRFLPGYGWGGELQVGGQLIVRTTAQRFDVDWLLERRGGDLTITDEGLTQSLGLSDLRVALNASNGTWHFTQAAAGTNFGVLVGAQTVRVPPATRWPTAQTPLEGVVSWRVENLTTLAPWLPVGWRAGGTLGANASLGGRFGAPEYVGEITGSKLALRNILEGVDVRDGDLKVQLRGADAKIDRMVFRGGEGQLRIEGGATFGTTPALSLRLAADRFQALGRVDRRVVTSGQASVSVSNDEWQIDGKFKVDEGLIDLSRRDAPSLDRDVTIVRRAGGPAQAASSAAAATSSTTPPFTTASPPPVTSVNPALATVDPDPAPTLRGPARKSRVNLQVDLGEQLQLKGRGIQTRLAGTITMTSPNNRLAVQGNIRTESGLYNAYGQNMVIERGVIRFTGPIDDPRLDIVALRPNLEIRVGVTITGTAQNPRVRLFSEPEMSDTDKLSWLILGRAPEGLGRADTALLQRAALALWAGEDGESPSDALLKTLGLDEFSVRSTESGDVRDTVVRVGKQIGRRWYIGYERGINTGTGTWQVIYRIAQRLTVRAQSGSDNSLDAILTWRWN